MAAPMPRVPPVTSATLPAMVWDSLKGEPHMDVPARAGVKTVAKAIHSQDRRGVLVLFPAFTHHRESHMQKEHEKPPAGPDGAHVILILQGGGSLGAYHLGVYQALAEKNLHPHWVSGISIGAFTAAVLAGNPPERRVERLQEF